MARTNVFPIRVPLYDYPHTRETSTAKDSYFKNCYPERLRAGDEQNPRFYVVKRPGIGASVHTQASGEGRGAYVWKGDYYYVVGNKLYKNGSALSVTLTTSTGRVYFEAMSGGSASEKLFLLEGQEVYSIVSAGTVTKHTAASGVPKDQVGTVAGGICNLDGYIFICDTDGKILHNDTQNDPTANMDWGNASIISANVYSDGLKGITRHLNYIVAFGEWSTEFFYNAGNPSPSILSRAEGTVLRYGTTNFATVWQDESIICWVARSKDGGNCVMLLEGLTPKIISTKPIERILNEATDMDEAYAYGIRIAGHVFYIINLPTTDKTLVFSLTDQVWCEWTSYNGATEGYFEWADIKGYTDTSGNTNFRALHATNGDVHSFDIEEYDDNGETIYVKIVTDKIDMGTQQRKFLSRLTILGDLATGDSAVNIGLRWTDDDYKNWNDSSPKTRDMRYIPYYTALGSFSRRAFEITFENDAPMRIEALELGIKLGSYAQGRL